MWLSQVVEYYRRFGREVLEQLFRFSLARLFRSRLVISVGAGFTYVGWCEFAARRLYSPSPENWLVTLLVMFCVWVALAVFITPVALDTEKRVDVASKQLEIQQLESICEMVSPLIWQEQEKSRKRSV